LKFDAEGCRRLLAGKNSYWVQPYARPHLRRRNLPNWRELASGKLYSSGHWARSDHKVRPRAFSASLVLLSENNLPAQYWTGAYTSSTDGIIFTSCHRPVMPNRKSASKQTGGGGAPRPPNPQPVKMNRSTNTRNRDYCSFIIHLHRTNVLSAGNASSKPPTSSDQLQSVRAQTRESSTSTPRKHGGLMCIQVPHINPLHSHKSPPTVHQTEPNVSL
jgi:hypothetical protein